MSPNEERAELLEKIRDCLLNVLEYRALLLQVINGLIEVLEAEEEHTFTPDQAEIIDGYPRTVREEDT
ncbi:MULTISPECIES: hypothetical protein [Rhizobium]|uniref:hypothetical protein n=1 Tax=Rhizobium phaseoli TaxID=396 RepID=UPI000A1E9577|nr:hypothetical protein [Rhizobium phaseoli]